jgi:hypothetical protein
LRAGASPERSRWLAGILDLGIVKLRMGSFELWIEELLDFQSSIFNCQQSIFNVAGCGFRMANDK